MRRIVVLALCATAEDSSDAASVSTTSSCPCSALVIPSALRTLLTARR